MSERTDAFRARLERWGISARDYSDEGGTELRIKLVRFGLVSDILVDLTNMTPEQYADYYARNFLRSVRDRAQEMLDTFERERWEPNGKSSINPTQETATPTPAS